MIKMNNSVCDLQQQKQKDVTELLARADDLAVQNTSYQEVYGAMAKTLAEAWKDLNKQLEYRKMLLDQSIAFHESAVQVIQYSTSRLVFSFPHIFQFPKDKQLKHLKWHFILYICTGMYVCIMYVYVHMCVYVHMLVFMYKIA